MRKFGIATIVISISLILTGCGNSNSNSNSNSKSPSNESTISNKITIEQAKEIALKHANLSSDEVSFIRADTEVDDSVEKYNIEFYNENKEYDYEINSADGQIIEYDFDVENYDISEKQEENAQVTKLSLEEAKEIVLKHANLTSDQVTFQKVELEIDDKTQKYDIDFYHDNKEYSYEIDANTGDVLSYEQD